MFWLFTATFIAITIILDIKFKFLLKKWLSLPLTLILPHSVLINNILNNKLTDPIPFIVYSLFLSVYFLIRLSFYITRSKIKLSLRIRIMMGGRRIFLISLAAIILQIPLCIFLGLNQSIFMIKPGFIIADIITSNILLLLLLLNGVLRIFLTSKRLGIVKRLVFLFTAWIPVINIIIGIWFCKIVKQEYLHEIVNTEIQNARAASQICNTKYPLLLLHGIGFRDFKYINYWGRIPALLIKNGASVYYGHQQAWGTIEDNAFEIKEKIDSIINETDCVKVNIIAHSKGGLDARYLISSLGMANRVASLTTFSTPHRGSELLDVLSKMKETTYKKICDTMDKYYKKIGDSNPNAFIASRQLIPSLCEEFNKNNPDIEGIYYQSYASQMKSATSHSLLSVPFAIMKWVSGDNDGLVTIDSAKWGEFKGIIKSNTNRGISHGDLIDLTRQDYEGFNIKEEFVTIVKELKKMGF